MKNFTYRSFEEKENIETILKRRKRKLNRQQILSGCILGVILVTLALYIGHHLYYTEPDGYVHVDANKVRTPFDIYLDSVYVHTGDFVEPGDTLYSYYMLDMLVDNANPNEEPTMIAVGRNYTLQHTIAVQEIEVMKVRIEEPAEAILAEDHNISFGLSDNSHKTRPAASASRGGGKGSEPCRGIGCAAAFAAGGKGAVWRQFPFPQRQHARAADI